MRPSPVAWGRCLSPLGFAVSLVNEGLAGKARNKHKFLGTVCYGVHPMHAPSLPPRRFPFSAGLDIANSRPFVNRSVFPTPSFEFLIV